MNPISESQSALLSLISSSLFGGSISFPTQADWSAVQREAVMQAVTPLMLAAMKCDAVRNAEAHWERTVYKIVASNLNIEFEHAELHELLEKHNIPYVILKGAASAAYYPDPSLRSMGDVDFLVHETDLESTGKLLESIGFKADSDDDGGIHVAYHRSSAGMFRSIWEMHRSLNGIPQGETGDACRKYLANIIETAVLHRSENGCYMVPDDFHHGLVLLLHTASHLTSEGVGLRHLCDWAVFVGSISNDDFASMFEVPLKEMGLWRFAQLLTLTSVKYIGCPTRAWAGSADEVLLEQIIADIMAGGNFGQKDEDRYRQIKYISNRGEHTVDKRNPVRQMLHTFNVKVKAECRFVQKMPVLLPVGWIVTGWRYICLVVSGRRKLDSAKTLYQAADRKNIYAEFHLFE